MRLKPPLSIPCQTVTISVDLPEDRFADAIVNRLLPILHSFGVPATWGLTVPQGPIGKKILASDLGHQIALLGSRHVGEAAGRGSLRSLLERGLEAVAGRQPLAMVVRHADHFRHLDLLATYGVSLLASDRATTVRQSQVNTLRYGLWEIPALVSFAGGTGISAGRRVRRLVDVATRQALVHL
ncbi:MAG: hypothetical protein N2C12_02305, partial [Planctomycetales bacterium]